jgi:hypothetical protein
MRVIRAIERWLTAYLAWLCKVFDVPFDTTRKDRLGHTKRGNQPPPEGGIAS